MNLGLRSTDPTASAHRTRIGSRELEVGGPPPGFGVVLVCVAGAALLAGAAVLATTINRER